MTAAAASAAKAAGAGEEEEEAALVGSRFLRWKSWTAHLLDVDELGSISRRQLCDADARAGVEAAEAAPPVEDSPVEARRWRRRHRPPRRRAQFWCAKPVSGASPEGELLKNDEGRTVVLGTGARSSGGGGLFASSNFRYGRLKFFCGQNTAVADTAQGFGVQTVAVVCGHEAYGAHGVQCESCKRFQSQLTNDEGNSVALGSDGDHQYQDYYCGELRQIPGTDGQCGPNNGRACASCVRLREAIEAVGTSEPRIDTGFSFAPRPTLNDRAMRQRPLLPPYCLPVLSEPAPISRRAATATRATAPTPLPRKDLQWTSAPAHCRRIRPAFWCARQLVGGTRADRRSAQAPRRRCSTFGRLSGQPVGSGAAHKRTRADAVVGEYVRHRQAGCGSGAAFRCPQCNFDICSVPPPRRPGRLLAIGSCSSRGGHRRAFRRQCSTFERVADQADLHAVAYTSSNQLIGLRSAFQAVSFTLVSSPSRRRARRAARRRRAAHVARMLGAAAPPGDAWVLRADLTHSRRSDTVPARRWAARSREFHCKAARWGGAAADLEPARRGGTCDTCSRNVRGSRWCGARRATGTCAPLLPGGARVRRGARRRVGVARVEQRRPAHRAALFVSLTRSSRRSPPPLPPPTSAWTTSRSTAPPPAAPRRADLIRWLKWAAGGLRRRDHPGRRRQRARLHAIRPPPASVPTASAACTQLESVGERRARRWRGRVGRRADAPAAARRHPPPARRLLDDLRARGK